jgi:hypothetical protein
VRNYFRCDAAIATRWLKVGAVVSCKQREDSKRGGPIWDAPIWSAFSCGSNRRCLDGARASRGLSDLGESSGSSESGVRIGRSPEEVQGVVIRDARDALGATRPRSWAVGRVDAARIERIGEVTGVRTSGGLSR